MAQRARFEQALDQPSIAQVRQHESSASNRLAFAFARAGRVSRRTAATLALRGAVSEVTWLKIA